MLRLYFAIALLTVPRPDWQLFESTAGRFSVSVPAAPEQTTTYTPAPSGLLPTTIVSVATDLKTEYMVSWTTYDSATFTGVSDSGLMRARDALVANKHGHVQADSAVALEGVSGRATTFTSDDGRVVEVWLFARANRFYQIMATSDGQPAARASSARFLNSFRLLP